MTRYVKSTSEVLRLSLVSPVVHGMMETHAQGQDLASQRPHGDRTISTRHGGPVDDSELIARKVLAGWECLQQVQEKMADKARSLHDQQQQPEK
ncbi:hypothetical protein AaE_009781 [Aphanomyces astaci]|uniref:Uncharacterized protein n=1 Tax=Aphanomyces astaci TaxID=112090 RepID=A0A6A5ABB6_APHAT|nr:hypothetical protein AaE_009781 [Aphanomyces astaci]